MDKQFRRNGHFSKRRLRKPNYAYDSTLRLVLRTLMDELNYEKLRINIRVVESGLEESLY